MITSINGIDLARMSNPQKSFINKLLADGIESRPYPCSDEEYELVEHGFVREQQIDGVYTYKPTEKCKSYFETREYLLVENYSGLVGQANASCDRDTL